MSNGYGPWGGPAFIVTSGDTGLGKTLDQWLAFPDAWCLCLPGSEKPTVQFFEKPVPEERLLRVRTIMQASAVLAKIAELPKEKRPRAVIIDDVTILAENAYAELKPLYPASHTFAFWDRIKLELSIMRDWTRHIGCWALCSTHLDRPDTDSDGTFFQGGPSMPSRKMRKALPHIADDAWIIEQEPGREPWPAIYRCEPDPSWLMKSRHGMRGRFPANIREILLSLGYSIPRPAGLERLDSVAEQVAAAILEGKDRAETVNRAEDQLLAAGWFPGHVYWSIRDGLDRAALRKRAGLLGRFRK